MSSRNSDQKKQNSGEKSDLIRLLSEAKAGDQKAYAELIRRYQPLISSLVSRSRASDMSDSDTEDLVQEATVSFCDAVKSFRPDQNVQFGLYAKLCISNRLVSYHRNWKREQRPLPIDSSDPAESFAEDIVESVIHAERFAELQDQIQRVLSPYESMVWWRYMAGRTAREIGAELGEDEKSVTNAIYRIRKKLRSLLS